MKNNTGMSWLRKRMDELGYKSLEQVAVAVGINRGNLYRYFTLETRPSIAMVAPLCKVLKTDAVTLLKVLDVVPKNAKL